MIQHSTGKSSVHIVGNVSVELQVLPRMRRGSDFSPELLLLYLIGKYTFVTNFHGHFDTKFEVSKAWGLAQTYCSGKRNSNVR